MIQPFIHGSANLVRGMCHAILISAVRLLLANVYLTAMALSLAGCAAIARPPATVESLKADGAALREIQRATIDSIIDKLARRAVARGDRPIDILLLSGGGQHGAYGAGFLRGWKSRTDAPMPRFDLVSGISTGALQAPFAFVGTDEALSSLVDLYRGAATRFAPKLDWLFWLRRTGGLVDTASFREIIATLFDEKMCRQLQQEFQAGRLLAIATTDFDLAIGRVWDIAREMDCSADGLARGHSLFLATSAIPGIFPPVIIDGHVHGDGGIVSNVLTVLDLDGYRRLAARLPSLGLNEPVTVRLWTLMNLWTHHVPTVMDPADRGALAQRGSILLFWTQQSQLLQRLNELARAVSMDVPGLKLEMRFTAVPSELSTEPGASALFDEAWMIRLEELGFQRARSASPWDQVASPYERPLPLQAQK